MVIGVMGIGDWVLGIEYSLRVASCGLRVTTNK